MSFFLQAPQSDAIKGKNLRAVIARSFIPYNTDEGTGRCRLPMDVMAQYGLRCGSLLRLGYSLNNIDHFDGGSILCAVYPDTAGALEPDNICIDDSVHIPRLDVWNTVFNDPAANAASLIDRQWRHIKQCTIISVYPPASCRSCDLHIESTIANTSSNMQQQQHKSGDSPSSSDNTLSNNLMQQQYTKESEKSMKAALDATIQGLPLYTNCIINTCISRGRCNVLIIGAVYNENSSNAIQQHVWSSLL